MPSKSELMHYRLQAWIRENKSNKYNKLINFPFKYNAEKFFIKENKYDIILVLNYNMNPTKKNIQKIYKLIHIMGLTIIASIQIKNLLKINL